MGWNDHVSFIATRCLKCGTVTEWEYWDLVGQQRYAGALGEKLGVHPSNSGTCPHCGSTAGEAVEGDDW